MSKRLMCAAIALCVASSANASTLRFKNYMAPEDEKQRLLNAMYLDGLKDGLIAFNIVLPRTGAAPLFCLPPTLVLTLEQADDRICDDADVISLVLSLTSEMLAATWVAFDVAASRFPAISRVVVA